MSAASPARIQPRPLVITYGGRLVPGQIVRGMKFYDHDGNLIDPSPPFFVLREVSRQEWTLQFREIGLKAPRGALHYYEVSVD